MERLSEKIQTIIIANNSVIVTNITCILAIIILLFLFVYLKCFYREDAAENVVSNNSNSSLIQYSIYTIGSSNENVSNHIYNDLIWHHSPFAIRTTLSCTMDGDYSGNVDSSQTREVEPAI